MSAAKKKHASKPANRATKPSAKAVENISKPAVKAAENASKATAEAVKATPAYYLSDLDSNVATPDQMVHAGTEAAKDFIAAGTEELKKTQEKVLLMSQENLEQWSNNTDKSMRSFVETFCSSQEQADAVTESCQLMSELCRDLHEQSVSAANALFTENVELSKDMLACRTVNDLLELQNRALQANLTRFFNQGANFSEAWFKMVTDVVEPLSSQAAQAPARMAGKHRAA